MILNKKNKNFLGKILNIKKNSLLNNHSKFTYKLNYNSIVPLDIYQTWYTKDLPEKMRENVENIKKQNPDFTHYLYDDNDCRQFIKENFKQDVLEAYDSLIPGAYKADLWRMCILFIKGGIYMDIKLSCVNGFKLIELTEKEHFVKDRPLNSVYNAFIVCKKGNMFLYKSIRQIVKNVKNKFYGSSSLSPTGPEMLGKVILDNRYNINLDMRHYKHGGYILYKNKFVISTEYLEYRNEQNRQYKRINTKTYGDLWNEKNIYKK